jgi:hypothetical protein
MAIVRLLIGQFWDSPYSNEREDGNPVYTATYQIKKGDAWCATERV